MSIADLFLSQAVDPLLFLFGKSPGWHGLLQNECNALSHIQPWSFCRGSMLCATLTNYSNGFSLRSRSRIWLNTPRTGIYGRSPLTWRQELCKAWCISALNIRRLLREYDEDIFAGYCCWWLCSWSPSASSKLLMKWANYKQNIIVQPFSDMARDRCLELSYWQPSQSQAGA